MHAAGTRRATPCPAAITSWPAAWSPTAITSGLSTAVAAVDPAVDPAATRSHGLPDPPRHRGAARVLLLSCAHDATAHAAGTWPAAPLPAAIATAHHSPAAWLLTAVTSASAAASAAAATLPTAAAVTPASAAAM